MCKKQIFLMMVVAISSLVFANFSIGTKSINTRNKKNPISNEDVSATNK